MRSVDFVLYVKDTGPIWLQFPIPDYMAGLGVIGLAILTLMAATSTRWAMKCLGKWWKRLHRLVYIAGVIALMHGLLEATSGKNVLVYNPWASHEVGVYLIVLILLLVVRIPAVRTSFANLRYGQFANRARQTR